MELGNDIVASLRGGGGAAAGKVSFQDLSIGKRIDAATAKLMLSCASGQHISSAVLTARQRNEGTEYLKIKMDVVLVTSVGVGEPGAGGEVTETVSFNFREVRVDYVGQSETGTSSPPVSFGWDMTQNAEA